MAILPGLINECWIVLQRPRIARFKYFEVKLLSLGQLVLMSHEVCTRGLITLPDLDVNVQPLEELIQKELMAPLVRNDGDRFTKA
jgi:hypothetical protein